MWLCGQYGTTETNVYMRVKNGTVDEQWKMLYEQCKNTVEKKPQIDDEEKKKNDEHYILNKPKVL